MDSASEILGVNLVRAGIRFLSSVIESDIAQRRMMIDENQAASQVRTELTHSLGELARQKLSASPEFMDKLQVRIENEIVREKVNLGFIFRRACEIIMGKLSSDSDSSYTTPEKEITEEWLDVIVPEAKQKSTEYMRELFARILAGEMMQPGSFSILSIKALSSLDQKTAELFVRLCSMGLYFESGVPGIRVSALGGEVGQGSLQKYGMDYNSLLILEEHRLIMSDFSSFYKLTPCRRLDSSSNQVICFPFEHQKEHWVLVPMSADKVDEEFRVYGVGLTGAGKELAKIISTVLTPEYTKALIQFFETNGYEMVRVSNNQPDIRHIERNV